MAQGREVRVAQVSIFPAGRIVADGIDVTIRHHGLDTGCFVVTATGWLTREQIASIQPDETLQKSPPDGCMTAILLP